MSELKNKLLSGFWKIRFIDSLPEDWEERLTALVHNVVDEALDDFPFERVEWDHQRFLRTKGYYNSAVNPYVARALEAWFERWFGVVTKGREI